MKYKLMIFLVVAGMCFSQDSSYFDSASKVQNGEIITSYKRWNTYKISTNFIFSFSDSSHRSYAIVGKDSMFSNAPYSAMVVLTILQYYQLYEKECYADSSLQSVYQEQRYFTGFDDLIPIRPTMKMVHREPNFTGFIEFLRKKAKERL